MARPAVTVNNPMPKADWVGEVRIGPYLFRWFTPDAPTVSSAAWGGGESSYRTIPHPRARGGDRLLLHLRLHFPEFRHALR